MKEANQITRKRQDVNVTPADLIQMPSGPKTEAGLRQNVAVGIGYVEAWLRGIGCVPLFNLMEDAATAEISRAQAWQWVRHNQKLDDGRAITKELVREIVREENDKVKAQMGEENYAKGRYGDAAQLAIDLVEQPQFYEFLTLPAYDRIIADESCGLRDRRWSTTFTTSLRLATRMHRRSGHRVVRGSPTPVSRSSRTTRLLP